MKTTNYVHDYYHPIPNTGQLGFNISKATNYKGWARELKDRVRRNSQWERVGLWLYPTKTNRSWWQIAFHACESSRHSSSAIKLDEACSCGEVVPEGIRMVILLESL